MIRQSIPLRVIALLTLLVAIFKPIDVSAQFSGPGQGTASDPYLIFNPVQLNQVRNFLNRPGVYFSLQNDIDLSSWIANNQPSMGWLPIGAMDQPFQGRFFGNNHTIKGLKINRPSTSRVGLFGFTSDASISDLTVEGDVNGKDDVGLLCGCAPSTTFTGIVCRGNVSGNLGVGMLSGYADDNTLTGIECRGNVTAYTRAGLLVGGSNSNTITNSKCYGEVKASGSDVGGVIGLGEGVNITGVEFYGKITGTSNLGGIVGYLGDYLESDQSISKCYAQVDIKSNNGDNVGGLIGNNDCTYSSTYKITSSSNSQPPTPSLSKFYTTSSTKITLTANGVVGTISGAKSCVGSLIGSSLTALYITYRGYVRRLVNVAYSTYEYDHTWEMEGPAEETITSCFAIMDIDAPNANSVGGLMGKGHGAISDSYFSGNIIGKNNVGGILGENGSNLSSCIQRCYATGTLSGTTNVGGILASSSAKISVTSNFSLFSAITASASGVGRIMPQATATNVTGGANGTNTTNYSLVDTKCSANGREHPYSTTRSEGDCSSASTMKLRATYQGLGWDFNNEWAIQETESYPYKKTQCVPPVIQSKPVAGTIILAGKSLSGGKVNVEYEGVKYVAEVSGNNWTLRTDPMKAGMPISVYAECDGLFPSNKVTSYVGYPGSGTAEDPWQIYTPSDLQNMNGTGYYKLMNDIDLTGIEWTPLGKTGTVCTQLDGDGYSIKGMKVDRPTDNNCGLFTSLDGTTIVNLNIVNPVVKCSSFAGALAGSASNSTVLNVTVSGGSVSGSAQVGGLVGEISNSTVSNVTVSGASVSGSAEVGGLAGDITNTGIEKCAFNGAVLSQGSSQGYAGGIVAKVLGTSTVTRCCNNGTVTNSNTTNAMAGGISGYCDAQSVIEDCFSLAEITGSGYTGGICALNLGTVRRVYASGNLNSATLAAGLVAYNDGAAATLTASVAANPQIKISSQTGNAMRVIAGVRNGAAIPTLGSNLALDNMIISVNDLPQEIYDDPMNGVATAGELLTKGTTYTALGWNMTSVWNVTGSSMPVLAGLDIIDGQNRNDNYMYVQAIDTKADDTFLLSVNLKNPTKTYTAQFDLKFPEGFSIVSLYDEDEEDDVLQVKKGARVPRASTITCKYANNVLRVALIGRETAYFTGDDGEIANILVKVDPAVVNGRYIIPGYNGHIGIDGFVDVALTKFSANITVLNDAVSVPAVEIMSGSTAEMIVNLNNKSQINAFQFDLKLPEGVTIAENAVGKPDVRLGSRCDSGYGIELKEMTDGSTRVAVVGTNPLTGNEGDMLVIGLKALSGMDADELSASMRNIYLANTDFRSVECRDVTVPVKITPFRRKGDVNVDGTITVVDVSGTQFLQSGRTSEALSFYAADIDDNGIIELRDVSAVRTLVMDEKLSAPRRKAPAKTAESYKIPDGTLFMYATPFAMTQGVETDFDIIIDSPNYRPNSMAGTVILPEGFSFKIDPEDPEGAYYENLDRCPDDWSTVTTLKAPNHVNFNGISFGGSSLKKRAGAFLRLKITASPDIAPGVYVGEFSNIEVSNDAEEYYINHNQKFSIIVGTPEVVEHLPLAGQFKTQATVALFGKYITDANLLSVDLTGIESWPADAAIATANPNALKFVSSTPAVAVTGNNVVKDGVCEQLVLTDGHSFGTPKAFTAQTATFTHTGMAAGRSTLYLPFTAQQYPAAAAFYTVEGYSAANEFVNAPAAPQAYTPLYVEYDSDLTLSATNAVIALEPAADQPLMAGSLRKGQAVVKYFDITGSQPVEVTSLLPFRAYATEELVNEIHTGINGVEIDGGEVEIYSIMGIRLNCTEKNLAPGIYIVNGKKTVVK